MLALGTFEPARLPTKRSSHQSPCRRLQPGTADLIVRGMVQVKLAAAERGTAPSEGNSATIGGAGLLDPTRSSPQKWACNLQTPCTSARHGYNDEFSSLWPYDLKADHQNLQYSAHPRATWCHFAGDDREWELVPSSDGPWCVQTKLNPGFLGSVGQGTVWLFVYSRLGPPQISQG